jgi:hypothetical protein
MKNFCICRRARTSFYLSIIILGSIVTNPSLAETNGDFDLYNGTPYAIVSVQFSTPNDNRWFPISGDQISPGETTRISFDAEYPCHQQLRVKLSDGEYITWNKGFNLCQTSRILIEPDPDGGYTAHYK